MKALNEIMEFDRGTDLVPALAVMLSVRLLAHAIRLRLRVAGLLGRCGVSHGSSRTASTPGSCSKLSRTLAGSVTLVLAVIHVVTIVFLHEDELIRNFVLQRLCGKFLIKTDN